MKRTCAMTQNGQSTPKQRHCGGSSLRGTGILPAFIPPVIPLRIEYVTNECGCVRAERWNG
ncbi:MAG: hypothetical protein ACRC46_15130 [Thermoguttaceae bacterium]